MFWALLRDKAESDGMTDDAGKHLITAECLPTSNRDLLVKTPDSEIPWLDVLLWSDTVMPSDGKTIANRVWLFASAGVGISSGTATKTTIKLSKQIK